MQSISILVLCLIAHVSIEIPRCKWFSLGPTSKLLYFPSLPLLLYFPLPLPGHCQYCTCWKNRVASCIVPRRQTGIVTNHQPTAKIQYCDQYFYSSTAISEQNVASCVYMNVCFFSFWLGFIFWQMYFKAMIVSIMIKLTAPLKAFIIWSSTTALVWTGLIGVLKEVWNCYLQTINFTHH